MRRAVLPAQKVALVFRKKKEPGKRFNCRGSKRSWERAILRDLPLEVGKKKGGDPGGTVASKEK